jgi:hypothetical protein
LVPAKPRIVEPGESPTTPAGIQLLADMEKRYLRGVPTYLVIAGAIGVVLAMTAYKPHVSVGVSIVVGTAALITFLLSVWARGRPRDAMLGFCVVAFLVGILRAAIALQGIDELANIPHIGQYVGAGWVLLVIVVAAFYWLWNRWQQKAPRD